MLKLPSREFPILAVACGIGKIINVFNAQAIGFSIIKELASLYQTNAKPLT